VTFSGGGKQGFQKAPKPDSLIVEGMGAMGTVQNERKLGYFEVALSGHMVPQFAPKVRFLPELRSLRLRRG
jgi:carboxypeptidase D